MVVRSGDGDETGLGTGADALDGAGAAVRRSPEITLGPATTLDHACPVGTDDRGKSGTAATEVGPILASGPVIGGGKHAETGAWAGAWAGAGADRDQGSDDDVDDVEGAAFPPRVLRPPKAVGSPNSSESFSFDHTAPAELSKPPPERGRCCLELRGWWLEPLDAALLQLSSERTCEVPRLPFLTLLVSDLRTSATFVQPSPMATCLCTSKAGSGTYTA